MIKSLKQIGKLSLIAFFLGLLIFSCVNNEAKHISEGTIEFDVKVISKDHPLSTLAPGTMTTHFKKDRLLSEMSTMGVFVSKFISDPEKKTFTSMVKIFNDKNVCTEHEEEIKSEIKENQLYFKASNETKTISGYLCKKMIATNAKNPNDQFDIYYTEELNIKNPNFSTPYEEIEGLVVQFRLKKFGMELEFSANKISKENIPNQRFEIPKDYKVISKAQLNDLFESIK